MPETETANRTIAIGDIHGCLTALDALLGVLELQPSDKLVILGDFIDRGLDSCGVLERLIEFRDLCQLIPLLGNHEEMLLDVVEGRHDLGYWLQFGGQGTLDSYGNITRWEQIPPAHIQFVQECRLFHETDTHIFVHAGVAPNFPMDQQANNDLLWRSLEPDETGPHYSGKTVIVGHTPQPDGQVLDLGFLKCIDTLCHDGGWLTALDVEASQIWQADLRGQLRESFLPSGSKEQKCG